MPLDTKIQSKDIKVIDDFLPKSEFMQLQQLMCGSTFSWYFIDIINYDWSEKEKNDLRNFQFVHLLLGRNQESFSTHTKLILDLFQERLNAFMFIRIKANLNVNSPNVEVYDWHTDYYSEWSKQSMSAVFYLNSNDGYTEFQDGTKIESIENRIAIFPTMTSHRATNCSNTKSRVVLNFNYFEDTTI